MLNAVLETTDLNVLVYLIILEIHTRNVEDQSA